MAIQYKVIEKGKPKAPQIALLKISGDRNLTASLDTFGPNYFSENIKEMQKQYSHPQTGEIITFREPTTAESIWIASHDFEKRAKPEIFDFAWLQLGRIVKTSEGVFANPPKGKNGKPIIDERFLKQHLNKAEKINGIYLGENDFSFAPYETFKRGVQDAREFVESGLARVLEHAKTAENLKEIASKKNYPSGVNVWGFNPVNKPVLEVASLGYGRVLGDGRLIVSGYDWGDENFGHAFGVLK